jgi:DNA-binding NtrC family response regulator
MSVRIAVIDDDPVACEFLEEALTRAGYAVEVFTSAKDALREEPSRFNLVISDIRMPDMDGLTFLRTLHERWPDLPAILMTAYGSLETTMEALKLGAWEYISKPFSPEDVRALVRKVLEVKRFRNDHGEGRPPGLESRRLVGSSHVMVELYKQIVRVAGAWASVLVEGESGTGKELVAASLHDLSPRSAKPFIVVHCGAIPETLLESELFGYERGAFTGADRPHPGLLESAEGGTIFLDEITEMSTALQAKLLRFMQEGELRRIGSSEVRRVRVRVVAATNRVVDREVENGRFRHDLLYRFVVRLRTPPLRERKEDLPQLIDFFLKKTGSAGVRISDQAMERLLSYDWPGNVRELENVLQQTILLSPYGGILPEHLPERFHAPKAAAGFPLLTPLEEAECDRIAETLRAAGGNKSKTARLLGIDRKTLRQKMKRYGLSGEEGGAAAPEADSRTGR